MPIDATKALAAPPRTADISWTPKDVLLYHLGIGAGRPATDLRYRISFAAHRASARW